MRPGQQNKRGRGRSNNNNNNNNSNNNGNNNNRKGSNPLTRTYDSSGPDVKIRGTAQHIAEKYAQLARDAQSSGDRVVAENYLQHAEHYNRIIASAQAQMQERFQREERQDFNDRDDDSDGDDSQQTEVVAEKRASEPSFDGSGPQPVIEGTPAEVSLGEETPVETSEQPQPRRRQPRQRRPQRRTQEQTADAGSEGDAEPAGEPALADAGE
jgi:hypothetical protein